MSSTPQTPDLFDAPLSQSAYSLDAAYTEQAHHQARTRWQWWWVLLVLLVINTALWLAFTEHRQVFGASSHQAPQSTIAPNKILPVTGNAANVAAPVVTAAPLPVLAAEKTVCMLWEFASNGEVKRADNRLAEQAWSGFVSELANEPPTYMVFVGPFNDRNELNTKIKVLDKMKNVSYSPLPSGLISLGVLSTEASAKSLAQTLTKRGLLAVETSQRTGTGKRTRYRFEGLSPDSLKELNILVAELGTLRACS